MSTLLFDGTGGSIGEFTPISAALADASNGAWTLAHLATIANLGWKATGGVTGATRANRYTNLGISSDGTPGQAVVDMDGGNSRATTALSNSSTIWRILVATRPAGASQTVRFHWKDITTPAAWVHENAGTGTTSDAAGPGTSGIMQVGGMTLGGEYWDGAIGLVAVWAGVNMTDLEVEALAANSKTSDWYNHAAGTPAFLTEMNATTLTDLTGGSTFSSLTSPSLTGSDPTGWTFDGTGAPAGPAGQGPPYEFSWV